MIKLVIFDMDGVLVDSEKATATAAISVLKKWGISAKHSDFLEYAGKGDDLFIGGVARKYGVEYVTEMKEEMYQNYFLNAKNDVKIFSWSKLLINTLKKDYLIALASAADYKKVIKNIECVGVAPDVFNVLVTGSDVEKKKPDPSIFLKTAEKAGISPDECIVFEDAISGVAAAKNAKMTVVAVTTTFNRDDLSKAGADFVVDDLSDAISIIENINK